MTKNILEWLEASCQKHPGKIAVADETAEMTYEELVCIWKRVIQR